MLIIVGFLASVSILLSLSSEPITPEFKYYDFRIYGLKGIYTLDNVRINYNFESQKGDMSFIVRGDNISINSLKITSPNQTNITSFRIYDLDLNSSFTTNIDYESNTIRNNKVTFYEFKKELDDISFRIEFEAINKTHPNGRFQFDTDAKNIYYKYDDFFVEWDRRVLMKFDLGDYRCNYPCISEVYPEKEQFGTQVLDNVFRVYENGVNPKSNTFALSMYDVTKHRWNGIFENIAIGLIVGLVVALSMIPITSNKSTKKKIDEELPKQIKAHVKLLNYLKSNLPGLTMRNEKIPSGTSWKRVLLEIYRFAPHQYGESNKIGINNDKHNLAKKLGISGYELMLAISFLIDQKLIERNVNPPQRSEEYFAHFILTIKGFEVALNLIRHQDSINIQYGIFAFTGIIVLTGFFGVLNELGIFNKALLMYIFLAVLVLFGTIGIYYISCFNRAKR